MPPPALAAEGACLVALALDRASAEEDGYSSAQQQREGWNPRTRVRCERSSSRIG